MFLGHFGLAFAAKKIEPAPSLATTFLAAQFVDLLWPFLLLAGLEHVEVDPGNTEFTPLNFVSYPYSHSLLAVLIWSAVFATIYHVLKKKSRVSIILGLLVFSHWILDFITHRPDLPLTWSGDNKYGLGLWNDRNATMIIEILLFAVGVWMYLRSTQAKNIWGTISIVSLLIFFTAIYIMNAFGDPPPNAEVIGYVGLAQWLFIAWAYWCDRTRRTFGSLENPKKGLE